MEDRLSGLRDALTRNNEEMRTLIDGLTEADLAKKCDNGWKVSQLAGHIAGSPSGDIYVAKRLAQGKNASIPGFLGWIIDLSNWWGGRKFGSASKADILAALEDKHNELFAYINTLSEDQLDGRGKVSGAGSNLGELSAYEYLAVQGPQHRSDHAAGIRSAIGA